MRDRISRAWWWPVNSSNRAAVRTGERIDSGEGRPNDQRALVEQLNQEEHSMSRIRLVAMFVAAAFSVWTVGSAVAQAPAPAAKPAETKPADPAKPAMETKPADKPTEKSAIKEEGKAKDPKAAKSKAKGEEKMTKSGDKPAEKSAATPATPAVPATPGDKGAATPAVPAKPAEPAKPASKN
jgi:hypothetical protein